MHDYFGLIGMHIPPIRMEGEQLVDFNKLYRHYLRESEADVKPSSCYLCGKTQSSFCHSHSLPKICLRSIAVNGKVNTIASVIGTNAQSEEQGVNQAGTFHLICSDCDNHVFKEYETPTSYKSTPSQCLMGQIALKISLFELAKSLKYKAFYSKLANDFGSDRVLPFAETFEADSRDDQRNIKRALLALKEDHEVYRLIHYSKLDYVTPVAFQTMINPVVDLEGNPLNDLTCRDQDYAIEPLYVCALPMEGFTALFAFVNTEAKRYDQFIDQFLAISDDAKSLVILQLVLAYCEEVYLSPSIKEVIHSNAALFEITRMSNGMKFHFISNDGDDDELTELLSAVLDERYALASLPSIPNLLSPEFALR